MLMAMAGCQTIDRGGRVADYYSAVSHMRMKKETVALDGERYSAATLYLNVASCISPDAVFGFHEAHEGDYATTGRSESGTQFLRLVLPACVRALADTHHAFDSANYTSFDGARILKACPQMKACPRG